MENILKFIASELQAVGINYEFMEWTDATIPQTYFTGEYIEEPRTTEDGLHGVDFIMMGNTFASWHTLETAKNTIERAFPSVTGKTAIMEDGSGVVVFFSHAITIPSQVPELKRIQINLDIKEWKVN